MPTNQLAALEATRDEFQQLLKQASLRWHGPVHEELLFDITESGVEVLAVQRHSQTWCTFAESYFEEISIKGASAVETILPVDRVYDGLQRFNSTVVEMEFKGTPGGQLASNLAMTGDVPLSQIDLVTSADVYWELTFDPQNYFTNQDRAVFDGTPAETIIKTTTDVLSEIIEKVDELPDLGFEVEGYPVQVTDSELRVYFEHPHKGDVVYGGFELDHVEGPNTFNNYGSGFKRGIKALSGEIELQTSPSKPIALVQRGDDHTIRHVITPV